MMMNLKRRQELSLDGIEISLFMIRICYVRLHQTIMQYSSIADTGGDAAEQFQNLILLDAWSLIDVINRLRILVSQTPGLKKDNFVLSFQKASASVEILRDFVQHLNSEIPKVEDSGRPIWGTLSWIFATEEMYRQKQIKVMMIIPGRLAKSNGNPIVNPAGKEIIAPVDHISLTASETTINLSELFRHSMKFGERFQAGLERAKKILQESGNDKNEILQVYLEQ